MKIKKSVEEKRIENSRKVLVKNSFQAIISIKNLQIKFIMKFKNKGIQKKRNKELKTNLENLCKIVQKIVNSK